MKKEFLSFFKLALTLMFCASHVFNYDCQGTDKYTKNCPPSSFPVWPEQFEQQFNEKFIYPLIGTQTTTGTFYYDSINKTYRVDRSNGHYDRYCGTIYPFSNTPCSHIVSEGKRYLYFPDKNYCCYCCSDEHGCGILKTDWLSGAKFEDYVTENGEVLEKWNKPGLQNNFYYSTVKEENKVQEPRKIDQQPNDIQEFNSKTFKTSFSNTNVFKLPSECNPNKSCPLLSICSAVRHVRNLNFLQDEK